MAGVGQRRFDGLGFSRRRRINHQHPLSPFLGYLRITSYLTIDHPHLRISLQLATQIYSLLTVITPLIKTVLIKLIVSFQLSRLRNPYLPVFAPSTKDHTWIQQWIVRYCPDRNPTWLHVCASTVKTDTLKGFDTSR